MPGQKAKRLDAKARALRARGALNPRPRAVTDPLFVPPGFFDPRDLVQVKYEMLRRVHAEDQSVRAASAAFGLSRPSFCGGLSPRAPGGRRVVARVRARAAGPRALRPPRSPAQHRTGAGAPGKKTTMTAEPMNSWPSPADALVHRYEALRRSAGSGTGDDGLGHALVMHQGVAAWIDAWANCRVTPAPPLEGVRCSRAGAGDWRSAADVLPGGVRGQVTRVLTGMVVASLRDRRA